MLKLARKNKGPRDTTAEVQIAFRFQANSKVPVSSLELLTAQAISRL